MISLLWTEGLSPPLHRALGRKGVQAMPTGILGCLGCRVVARAAHQGSVCAGSVFCGWCACSGHTFWDGGVGDRTVAACWGSVCEFWVAPSRFSVFSARVTAPERGWSPIPRHPLLFNPFGVCVGLQDPGAVPKTLLSFILAAGSSGHGRCRAGK